MTIFSKIIAGEIPAYTVAESELFIAFLDILPLKKGHVLIVPKIEIDKIFDVPDNYLSELLLFAKPLAKAIEKAFPCNRVNMLTVGLEVPHAHLHLIPTDMAADMNLTNKKLQLTKDEFTAIQQQIIARL